MSTILNFTNGEPNRLALEAGSYFERTFDFTNEDDDSIIDLTGYSARMQVRASAKSDENVLDIWDKRINAVTVTSAVVVGRTYGLTVDGVTFTYVAITDDTKTLVLAGLASAMTNYWNANPPAPGYTWAASGETLTLTGTFTTVGVSYLTDTIRTIKGLSFDGPNGRMTLSIPEDAATNVISGNYVYDLDWTTDTGRVERMFEGRFMITPEVTR